MVAWHRDRDGRTFQTFDDSQGDDTDCERGPDSPPGDMRLDGKYITSTSTFEADYDLTDKELGTGLNGAVRLGLNRMTGKKVAVKTFHMDKRNRRHRIDVQREIAIQQALDHPCVGRIESVYKADGTVRLVLEYMEGGDLFDAMKARKVFKERSAAWAISQVLEAADYLHKHNLVHRDIKPENIMFTSDAQDRLKLIDFGFATKWKPNSRYMTRKCGTKGYRAPEVIQKCYTNKCDIYSIGVVAHVLLTGHLTGMNRDWTARYAPNFESLSQEARDFVESLLNPNAEERPSAEKARRHPWLGVLSSGSGSGSFDMCSWAVSQQSTVAPTVAPQVRSEDLSPGDWYSRTLSYSFLRSLISPISACKVKTESESSNAEKEYSAKAEKEYLATKATLPKEVFKPLDVSAQSSGEDHLESWSPRSPRSPSSKATSAFGCIPEGSVPHECVPHEVLSPRLADLQEAMAGLDSSAADRNRNQSYIYLKEMYKSPTANEFAAYAAHAMCQQGSDGLTAPGGRSAEITMPFTLERLNADVGSSVCTSQEDMITPTSSHSTLDTFSSRTARTRSQLALQKESSDDFKDAPHATAWWHRPRKIEPGVGNGMKLSL